MASASSGQSEATKKSNSLLKKISQNGIPFLHTLNNSNKKSPSDRRRDGDTAGGHELAGKMGAASTPANIGSGHERLVMRRMSRAFSRALEVGGSVADEFGDLLDLAGSTTTAPVKGQVARSISSPPLKEMQHIEGGGFDFYSDIRTTKEGILAEKTDETKKAAEEQNVKDMGFVEQQALREAASRSTTEGGELVQISTRGGLPMSPREVIFKDKMAFFLGVFNVVLTAWWIGAYPKTYHYLWGAKALTLFPLRWLSYRKKRWHYLMFEYCYVANCIGLYHCFFAPKSPVLHKITFSMGAGPLLCSILAMRNSLVFHDIDKTTTLMMHLTPALVSWTIRWYPNDFALSNPEFQVATWQELFIWPVLIYLLWVLLYYILNFVVLHDQIQKAGGATMFSIMVPKHNPRKIKKSAIARTVLKAPEKLQPLAYLCIHGVAAIGSFLPTVLYFKSFWAHSFAVLFCLSVAVWNGGTFYFEIFAAKYMSRLQEALAQAEAEFGGIQNKKED